MDEQSHRDWPAAPEASQRAGVSPRTLRRMADRDEVRRGFVRISGRKPLPVFCPEDLDRVRKSMAPSDAVKLPQKPARKRLKPQPLAVDLKDRVFLNLRETAALSGLPRNVVAELANTGKLYGFQRGNRWYISRESVQLLGTPTERPPQVLLTGSVQKRPDHIGTMENNEAINGTNNSM